MRIFLLFFLFPVASVAKSQKIDSIYLNLYTDSLKKGFHNYINVDGKLSNGKYLPLDNSKIDFWSNTGKWEGNDLIIDSSYKGDSVIIKATLKEQPSLTQTVTIYIKKKINTGLLKTEDEILNGKQDK